MLDKDFLLEMRRNAYVECTENYLESNTVVGMFGDCLPEEVFYACGTVPVPIEGVDSHIFKFGKAGEWDNTCDVIKSTLIYLTTEKCPILYSCKMYVLQPSCNAFIDAIKANTEKPVLVYTDEASLIQTLCHVYGTSYSEEARSEAKADLDYIKTVLEKIKYYSTIDCETYFLLEFYSKYMTSLKMRRAYFESIEKEISFTSERHNVKELGVICPRGNYRGICLDIEEGECRGDRLAMTRLKRVWKTATYGYVACPFECEKKISYHIQL